MNIMQIKINNEWLDVIGIIYHNENAPCDILRGKSIDNINEVRMKQPQEKSLLETLEDGLDNVCNQIDALEKNFNALAYKVREIDARTCAVQGIKNDVKILFDVLDIDSNPAIKDIDGNNIVDETHESCTIRNLAKRIDELEETVAKYEATKDIISQDEAFDKAGLNTIEMWVARELYGDVLLSDNKAEPTDEEGYDGLKYPKGTRLIELGRKVFPSLTRANSPQKVELKMIDNDD
jgi:hypothetical protein